MSIPALQPPSASAPAPSAPQAAPVTGAPDASTQIGATEKAPPANDPRVSTIMAKLARKERELQQRELQIKTDSEKVKEYYDAKNSKNPIKALQALGMSYQDATEYMLNEGQPTTEQKLKMIEERLSAKEAEELKKAEESKKSEIEKNIGHFKRQIRDEALAQAEKYELIVAHEAYEEVFNVIEEYYNEHEVLPNLQDAFEHVESYLEEQARKLLSLKKLSPKSEAKEDLLNKRAPDTKPAATQPSVASTLTNSAVSSARPTDSQFLSDDESKRRAAALIRWS